MIFYMHCQRRSYQRLPFPNKVLHFSASVWLHCLIWLYFSLLPCYLDFSHHHIDIISSVILFYKIVRILRDSSSHLFSSTTMPFQDYILCFSLLYLNRKVIILKCFIKSILSINFNKRNIGLPSVELPLLLSWISKCFINSVELN